MRYEFPLRYLARMWLDVAPMRPTDAVFARARALMGRPELQNGVGQDPVSGQRPALFSRTGLQVLLPGESFDVAFVPTIGDDGTDRQLPAFAVFVDEVATYMSAFARGHERHAYRLALVKEGFLEMAPQVRDELPRRIFRIPEPFAATPPFEWDWRLASQIDRDFAGARERVNTVATLKRASGSFVRLGGMEAFDKVRLDIDISTAHNREQQRFDPGQVETFFRSCLGWQNELWRQMEHALQMEG